MHIPGHEIMAVTSLGFDVLLTAAVVFAIRKVQKAHDAILGKVGQLTRLVKNDLLRRSPHEHDHVDD